KNNYLPEETIQVVKGGSILVDDLLKVRQKLETTATARSTVPMDKVVYKPNKRMLLEIRCTGNNYDGQTEYEWFCEKCSQTSEYCPDDECCYCSCGQAKLESYEFRCTDFRHGLGYEKHDSADLKDLVNKIRPLKERNILLLGKTGVGKST